MVFLPKRQIALIMTEKEIRLIEQELQYEFVDKKLLIQAFTHSSYANIENIQDNERMEFFGDAILDAVVSEYLLINYPTCLVGQLSTMRSNIVSANALRPVVDELGILKYLQVANGADRIKNASKKIESNLYEAIVAAIYLDGGISATKEFISRTLCDKLANALVYLQKDSKTQLQEYCQHNKIDAPKYKLIERVGSDNAPQYKYGLYIDGLLVETGVGTSKKIAEQDAATKIVTKWRIE